MTFKLFLILLFDIAIFLFFGKGHTFLFQLFILCEESRLLSSKVILLIPFSHTLNQFQCKSYNCNTHVFQNLSLLLFLYFNSLFKIFCSSNFYVRLRFVKLAYRYDRIVNLCRKKLIVFIVVKLSADEQIFIKGKRIQVCTSCGNFFVTEYFIQHLLYVLFGFRIFILQFSNIGFCCFTLFVFNQFQ